MTTFSLRKKRILLVSHELDTLFPTVKTALDYHTPFELLVAVILSAQCTDARVNIVTKTLFQKYKTVEDYMNANPRQFEQDIFSTGFYRSKAKHILASARIVHMQFHDQIPRTMSEIMTLPGVARKTANVVLSELFDIREGIAVDTHVKRLSQKYGLTDQKTPEKIEQDLMKVLPKGQVAEI
jgi:endonuclease-3